MGIYQQKMGMFYGNVSLWEGTPRLETLSKSNGLGLEHHFLEKENYIKLPSLELTVRPENGWLGDYFPFEKAYFQVLC